MSVSYDYQYKDGTTGNTYWQNGDPNSEGKLLGRTDGYTGPIATYATPNQQVYSDQGNAPVYRDPVQAPQQPAGGWSAWGNTAAQASPGAALGGARPMPLPRAQQGGQQGSAGGWQPGQPWWGAGYGPPGSMAPPTGSKGGGMAPAPAPAPTWSGSATPAPAPAPATPAPQRENWGGGNGSQIGSAPSGKGKGSDKYAGGIAPPTINAPYVKPPPPPGPRIPSLQDDGAEQMTYEGRYANLIKGGRLPAYYGTYDAENGSEGHGSPAQGDADF